MLDIRQGWLRAGPPEWVWRKVCGWRCLPISMPISRPLTPVSWPRASAVPNSSSCLGDYVGYGADPEWTVDAVMALAENGAIAVRGNHDTAVGIASETMNADAQAAIEWTRGRLNPAQRRYLAELPLTLHEDDRLYVHSEASHPERWRYVRDTSDAARSIMAASAQIGFCGHIHRPALYSMSVDGENDELCADRRRPRAAAAGPALARRARLRGPAARQRSVGLVCNVRYRGGGNSPIAVQLTISRRRRRGSARTACRAGLPIACLSVARSWPSLPCSRAP